MSDPGSALRYALKLLGYRGRSEKELSGRLADKGFDDEVVAETIGRLRRLGYLDDAALAASLRRRAEQKHLGASGARQYLRKMGIPVEIAGEALAGYDEAESAGRLVEKKLRAMKDCPPVAAKRKLSGMLLRRGYSAETVRRAISRLERQP